MSLRTPDRSAGARRRPYLRRTVRDFEERRRRFGHEQSVTFDPVVGWECDCVEFVDSRSCLHIRAAGLMRVHWRATVLAAGSAAED